METYRHIIRTFSKTHRIGRLRTKPDTTRIVQKLTCSVIMRTGRFKLPRHFANGNACDNCNYRGNVHMCREGTAAFQKDYLADHFDFMGFWLTSVL
jgi:hypothetical protein